MKDGQEHCSRCGRFLTKEGVCLVCNSPFGEIVIGLGEPSPWTEKEKTLDDKVSSFPTLHLPRQEYAHVMSEIATNMSKEQRRQRIVHKAIGDYIYIVENKSFETYRIIGKIPIDEEL